MDTRTKKAAAGAASSAADRFAEKVKSAPEYSVLEGPIVIKVLVENEPTQKL